MRFSLIFSLLSLVGLSIQEDYSNPLKSSQGSDPFIVTDLGYYYLLTSTWSDVQITRAKTLEGLKTGEKKVVYRSEEIIRCCYLWSPELWKIDGVWYLYFTAGTKESLDGQRVHVLTGGKSPFDDFTYTAQLTPSWGIDATIFRTPEKNYLVWSGIAMWQSLFIAELLTPSTITSPTLLSEPTIPLEQVQNPVNEGPAALYAGGKSYLTYSASDCWTADYQLGLLTWDGVTDPLRADAWTKSGPVMNSANGNYGTGHNGFFTSFDQSETWIVYHATSRPSGNCGAQRYTMAQKMNFNGEGAPIWPVIAPPLNATLPGPAGEDIELH
ncbi:hypothetical protein HYALB_00001624 [Hymenoscyphus albidus]|uniref:Glycoside hydrolase family 43 protein n=1 Tax=Hymenoscyphus albidus TaxID=595503 RepID=A0A9N9Q3K6_9HELO|nr:hypothetical protein HYALB_00001624 [Hymenoscyphus albidus]